MLLRLSLYANLALLAACLLFAGLWKFEQGRKHKILADFGRAQFEADLKRSMLEAELAEARKKRPPVAPKIKEVIRANPSGCRVPAPVHDGLQDAVREANASRIGT